MFTKRHKPTTCPTCGKQLDASSAIDGSDAKPQPGDVSVCFGCGTVLRYRIGLVLERMSQAEIALLPEETRAELARALRGLEGFNRTPRL